jgi:hypothetical protein
MLTPRVEFVNDKIIHNIERPLVSYHYCECSCPAEDKINKKDSFYEELEYIFDKIPEFYMNILLSDFSAEVIKKAFLNRQLGTKIYTKLILIMELQ